MIYDSKRDINIYIYTLQSNQSAFENNSAAKKLISMNTAVGGRFRAMRRNWKTKASKQQKEWKEMFSNYYVLEHDERRASESRRGSSRKEM